MDRCPTGAVDQSQVRQAPSKPVRRLGTLLVAACALVCTALQAGVAGSVDVPEPLQPWVGWVLHDVDDARCPDLYNAPQRQCAWPSRLKLQLEAGGGRFRQSWRVDGKSWLYLAGSTTHWPQNVRINGEPALVVPRQGRPAVRAAPGRYEVEGEFLWDNLPETLKIPPETGLVSLSVEGAEIPFPELEEQGRLWLRSRESANRGEQGDRLDLQVFRRIVDANPLQMVIHVDLDVSGVQREVLLGRALPDSFIPLQITSRLPARLEPDRRLRVQIRPGRWSLELTGRAPGYVTELSRVQEGEPWPEEEVWVFDARHELRLVEVQGVPAVDPRQTRLPEDWRGLPAYRVLRPDRVHFRLIRRGDPEPEPDRLSLERTLWLDFEGKGYTLRDRISGTMTEGWRLDVRPGIELGRVLVDGTPRLITRLPGSDAEGFEVRRGAIQVIADSRYTGPTDSIPAVGWDRDFHHVSAELRLPPGWKLFSASGVDSVPGTWLQRWTLLDLFLVLIAVLAVMRLWGWPWALLALLTLGLIWHEPGAPRYVWLNILASVALLRVLPTGRLRNAVVWYRNLTLLALVLIAVPFLVQQARIAIYPQLERPWQRVGGEETLVTGISAPARLRGIAGESLDVLKDGSVYGETEQKATANRDKEHAYLEMTDPDASVQTGPGVPRWRWHSVALDWNGPVERDQVVRLRLLSPDFNLALNLLRVILVCLLALRLMDRSGGGGLRTWLRGAGGSGAAALLAMASVISLVPADVSAAFPDSALLETLRQRILAAPACLPECASVSRLRLSLSPDTLQMHLEASALRDTAIPLPANPGHWLPAEVETDGVKADGLFRTGDGELWLTLAKGHHQILLSGPTVSRASFQLPLPLRPHRVELEGGGWVVDGLHEDGIADEQLQFTRVRKAVAEQPRTELEPGTLPPFVRIERTLRLGLDWIVDTRVVRLSPQGSAIILNVPLLGGEGVVTDGIHVDNGSVLVNLAPEQRAMAWQATLEKQPGLTLRAAEGSAWTELWRLEASPIWHVHLSGIPVTHHLDGDRSWLPEWQPWPGETVDMSIDRPIAARGRTLTIDNSRLSVRPGQRATDAELTFALRSSQGTQHTLTLPDGARLQSVTIDGTARPVRQEGRTVTLPVVPGQQAVTLAWREPHGIGSRFTTPAVDLGARSVNNSIQVTLGRDRWVLWTEGPQLGPAVLYWAVLLVVMLIAVALGRIPLTPLGSWQWFLLGIGLSQSEIWAGVLIVGWLLSLGLRARLEPDRPPGYFNAIQIGLFGLTLVALTLLFETVRLGLLGQPEMQIAGNNSTPYVLNWYQDRADAQLPRAWIISLPLWAYHLLMLAWSLWLAFALLRWLRWGWECFSTHGLWRAVRIEIPHRSSSRGASPVASAASRVKGDAGGVSGDV
jgi:hypothetical protein